VCYCHSNDEFKMGKVLLQGDLLLPFLFLLHAKGLNMMSNSLVDVSVYWAMMRLIHPLFVSLIYNLLMMR